MSRNTVGNHTRGLDHQAEGMAEGVGRIISAKGVKPHVMQTADVHRQAAAESLRFFVERPVDFTCRGHRAPEDP